MSSPSLAIGLSAAIFAVTREVPRVLTVARSELGHSDLPALPFGKLARACALPESIVTLMERLSMETSGCFVVTPERSPSTLALCAHDRAP